MSLICTPSIVPASGSNEQEPIANDGFLPAIDPDAIEAAVRFPSSVQPARKRAACIGAILTLAPDLASWIAAQKALGHAELAAVPAAQIDGKSVLTLLYERAVGALAKAEVIERHRDIDQAGGGQRDAAAIDATPDQLRRDAMHALRQMLGIGASTIELI